MAEPVTSYDAYWSPDGSRLALIVTIDARDDEIFIVDADGRNLRQLTTVGDANIDLLVWSPNSEIIYYAFPPYPTRDWYRIPRQQQLFSISLFGNHAVAPNENAYATQEENEASVVTRWQSDTLYVNSVCNEQVDHDNFYELMNCWHDLEVYSVATGELVWKIGRYQYRAARFGLLATLGPGDYFVMTLISIVSGSICALLRAFRQTDNRKSKAKNNAI